MGAEISYPGMCWAAVSCRLCWLLHLGSLCWVQRCLLVKSSLRSIFKIRDQDRSVLQVSNQACSATSEMFLLVVALRWAPGAVLWGLMICFLTLLAFCVVFWRCYGTSLGWVIALLNQEKLSPRSMEGRGWVFHGTDCVPGTDGLSLGMFCGSDRIAVDVFQENFQHL